ncbi:hypothetical protein [Streptosporangium canum]|uniref:hypothetical protein n=1 Tax=Streptosporangium canum TaxID=324952 RepID=UPI0037B9332B
MTAWAPARTAGSPGRRIEIARRLDIHPTDLVPDLESVLGNRHIHLITLASTPDLDDDALAAAEVALSVDALAEVLDCHCNAPRPHSITWGS